MHLITRKQHSQPFRHHSLVMRNDRTQELGITKTHHSPVLDLGLEDVLDRHLEAVPDPHAGVDGAEAALAQDGAEGVGLLERLGGGTANGVTGHNCKKKVKLRSFFIHVVPTFV